MPLAKSKSPFETLTNDQLRTKLSRLGEKVAGNKEALVDRLEAAAEEALHSEQLVFTPDNVAVVNPNQPPLPSSTQVEIRDVLALVGHLEISDNTQLAYAGELSLSLAELQKQVVQFFKPNRLQWERQVANANKGLKGAVSMERVITNPMEAGISRIKSLTNQYRLAEKRRQDEESKKIEADLSKSIKDRMIEEIIKLESEGKYKEAEDIEKQLASVSGQAKVIATRTVQRVSTVPKVKGLSSSFGFTWEFIDSFKLDRSLLMPDTRKINKLVKEQGFKAEDLAGKGSIKVTEISNTRRTRG